MAQYPAETVAAACFLSNTKQAYPGIIRRIGKAQFAL